MSSEDSFPVEDAPAGAEAGAQIRQFDLSELASHLAPSLKDPATDFVEGDASRPKPAKKTEGPHRLSIVVPHDEGSVFNLGQGSPYLGDAGITGRTNTHVHFFATPADSKTMLSLGTPSNTEGFDINRGNAGFSLVTQASNVQVADKQVVIASMKGHMNLRAKGDFAIESNKESVTITAKQHASTVAQGNVNITAGVTPDIDHSFWSVVGGTALSLVDGFGVLQPATAHVGPNADKYSKIAASTAGFFAAFMPKSASAWRDHVQNKYHTHVEKLLKHLASIGGLVLAFKRTRKAAKPGQSKWETANQWLPFAMGAYAEVMALKADLSTAPTATSGEVNITAKGNVTVNADATVSIFGFKSATLNGFKSATVTGLSASMKGHKDASVWAGMSASVKALVGDVLIASDLKRVTIGGKLDVAMASEAGKATFTSALDAQLNSIAGSTFVHGKEGAVVGAGGASGYGMVVKPDHVSLGALANLDKFATTVGDRDLAMVAFNSGGVQMQKSKLQLTSSKVIVKTGSTDLRNSGNVTIKGSKVLLG